MTVSCFFCAGSQQWSETARRLQPGHQWHRASRQGEERCVVYQAVDYYFWVIEDMDQASKKEESHFCSPQPEGKSCQTADRAKNKKIASHQRMGLRKAKDLDQDEP